MRNCPRDGPRSRREANLDLDYTVGNGGSRTITGLVVTLTDGGAVIC